MKIFKMKLCALPLNSLSYVPQRAADLMPIILLINANNLQHKNRKYVISTSETLEKLNSFKLQLQQQ